MDVSEQQPVFSVLEPVMAVANVAETVRYWQDVLAFPNKWLWDPPHHGGVSWHDASLQFTEDAELAKRSAGNVIWMRVQYLDQLYRIHQERKADIIEGIKRRPWGLDEYWVKDINGYNLIFSGFSDERKKSVSFPEGIQLEERKPTAEEYEALLRSVNWFDAVNGARFKDRLAAMSYSVLAVDTKTGDVVGSAFLLSDNASFYYVKDVIVKPEWQGKRIGTALMKSLCTWLDKNAIPKSLVGLYTRENLEPFYKQFGFGKTFGMVKTM